MTRRGFLRAMLAAGAAPAIITSRGVLGQFVPYATGGLVPAWSATRAVLEWELNTARQMTDLAAYEWAEYQAAVCRTIAASLRVPVEHVRNVPRAPVLADPFEPASFLVPRLDPSMKDYRARVFGEFTPSPPRNVVLVGVDAMLDAPQTGERRGVTDPSLIGAAEAVVRREHRRAYGVEGLPHVRPGAGGQQEHASAVLPRESGIAVRDELVGHVPQRGEIARRDEVEIDRDEAIAEPLRRVRME